jgi:hypothetical protein
MPSWRLRIGARGLNHHRVRIDGLRQHGPNEHISVLLLSARDVPIEHRPSLAKVSAKHHALLLPFRKLRCFRFKGFLRCRARRRFQSLVARQA